MFKAILIDDEPLARALICEYLADHSEIEVVAQCGDGFEGLKAIHLHKPDLIFLDIQMPKISGFEMLELLDSPPAVIFTTAYDAYALKAFDNHALDYLLKPFSKERFDKALKKWTSGTMSVQTELQNKSIESIQPNRPEESGRIVVKTQAGIKIIPVSEIHYLEAYDDYVKIFTTEGMFLKKKTLSYYENSLSAYDFIRPHRSYLISLQRIIKIEQPEKEVHVAYLKSGNRIPLSKQGYARLKLALGL